MAGTLKRFTDEQIERANRVDILQYARSQGLELKRAGKSYEVKNYSGGFYITPEKNSWNWFNEQRGGSVIQLCMELENKTWVEAIRTLLNEDMEPLRRAADWKPAPEQPKEFHLPEKNNTYSHVFAYLVKSRGIDAGILKEMVDKGYIYENKQRSCVFIGKDKDGNAKHASVRSTNTIGKAFKQDVAGSQKAFSFSISGKTGILNVFEAPIDALSYMSLQKLHGIQVTDSYISLGGVTEKALERFLADNKNIEKIRVCTDHDEAGEGAAAKIYERFGKEYKVTRHRPNHKDFNEDLVAIRQQEKQKKQSQKQEQQVAKERVPPKEESEIAMTLSKVGVSQKIIDWYVKYPNATLQPERFEIQGLTNTLFVCENPIEALSIVELRARGCQEQFGQDIYISKGLDNYLAYSDIQHLNEYLQSHPDTELYICAGQTERSLLMKREIEQGCILDSKKIYDIVPQMKTFSEDVSMIQAVDEALDEPPAAQEMELAVGMEV